MDEFFEDMCISCDKIRDIESLWIVKPKDCPDELCANRALDFRRKHGIGCVVCDDCCTKYGLQIRNPCRIT